MVWAVLVRRLQFVIRGPVSEIEAILQVPAGQNEYLSSIPISIAASPQWLMSGNRQRRKGQTEKLTRCSIVPDDLLRFQVRRLAIS